MIMYICDHTISKPVTSDQFPTSEPTCTYLGRSTDAALSEDVDKTTSAHLRSQQAKVISLDCSSAFNSLLFESTIT